jgi:carboxypeptidase family protein
MRSQQFAIIPFRISQTNRVRLWAQGFSIFLLLVSAPLGIRSSLQAQSLGNAGTIEGIVIDPTGAIVPKAEVSVHNAISGYSQTVVTGTDGSFRIG